MIEVVAVIERQNPIQNTLVPTYSVSTKIKHEYYSENLENFFSQQKLFKLPVVEFE